MGFKYLWNTVYFVFHKCFISPGKTIVKQNISQVFHPVKQRWNTNTNAPTSLIFDQQIFKSSRQHHDTKEIERGHRDLLIGAGLASQFLRTNELWRRGIWSWKRKFVKHNLELHFTENSVKNVLNSCFTNSSNSRFCETRLKMFFTRIYLKIVFHKYIGFPC